MWSESEFSIDKYAKAISMEQAVEMYTEDSMFVSYTNDMRHLVNGKIHGDQEYFIKGHIYIAKYSFGKAVNGYD